MEVTMKKLIIDKKLWFRRTFLILYDIAAMALAGLLALLTRFEFRFYSIEIKYLDSMWKFMPLNILLTLFIFYLFRMYQSLWAYAGITEVQNILSACVMSALVHMLEILVLDGHMPRTYYPLYGVYLLLLILSSRFLYRVLRMKRNQWIAKRDGNIKNVMIIGAGEAGSTLIKEITNSRFLTTTVKCVIDDDQDKIGSFIHGIKVVGNRNFITEAANIYNIDQIILALPSVSRKTIKEIILICKETNCTIKTLPGIYQMVNGDVTINQVRDIDVEDLLGREPVEVDLESIIGYVTGKVILVTGGGGSIGSEICRQIAGHHPKQLIIVDFYENNAYEIQQELIRKYKQLDLVVLIASVRNTNRMNQIMEQYHPDIVYHAAAHKHVPLMEVSPNEAVKNNVFGTLKTVRAAADNGVKKFVLISTDKAVNPTNIMGASKRICEMIIQSYNRKCATEFVAVRFGNVLGSNGSVIPLFRKQIEEGGPVTVTHPDIVRYFMTIPEAVSLVLQAGAYAKGGEIFILNMGEPVRILDLAKNMIRLSGFVPEEDIPIIFTGIRPGEKLYKEVLMDEEGLQETPNKMIRIGKPIEFDEEEFYIRLARLKEVSYNETGDIREMIHEIVPTYIRQEETKIEEDLEKKQNALWDLKMERKSQEMKSFIGKTGENTSR